MNLVPQRRVALPRCVAKESAPEEIERLLQEHLPGLRAFVRLQATPEIRAQESVSDIVQSVCREVLTHADRFQHPGDGCVSCPPWTCRSVWGFVVPIPIQPRKSETNRSREGIEHAVDRLARSLKIAVK